MDRKGHVWMSIAAFIVIVSLLISLATWFLVGYMTGSLVDAIINLSWIFYLVFIASFIFWLWTLVDSIKRDYHRPEDKFVWVVVIIFTWIVGSFIYYYTTKSKTGAKKPAPRKPGKRKKKRS